jgi:serine/threonine protein kinase
MFPEQWGEDAVDARTDLWAVGIVLYEMVTGEHPLAPLSMLALGRWAFVAGVVRGRQALDARAAVLGLVEQKLGFATDEVGHRSVLMRRRPAEG